MKAAKRKRAAAAPARAAAAVISDVAEQAAPSVAAVPAMPAIEDAAAAAILVAQMPEVVVAKPAGGASPASQPVVMLGANCTVKDAAALKQSLCTVLDSEATVVIDVSSVARIDTAAIQVLCAFVRQRAANARSVAWLGIPAAVREAAVLLGVSELLMLPAAAGAAP